jgi:hypothetical protein
MFSFWRARLFHQTWHPSFEDLMLYLDGELGAGKEPVGTHTRNCWSCRLRLEKIEKGISEFMEARNASFGGSSGFPTQVLPAFAAKLERLEAESGGPSLFSGLIQDYAKGLSAPRVTPRLAIFLASLCLIVAVFTRLNVTQPSAKVVLSRVREAEAREMGQVLEPVIYEKLELRRSSRSHLETVSWEIWNDTKNKRLRQRVNATPAPVLEDYGEVFRSHRADVGWPLSPSNYEVWRGSILKESEEVLEGRLPNGDKATILKLSGQGPFPPDAIVGAEFTVRVADWHPVGERLLVQKRDEVVDYSLGEVAFDVMALSAVPASIFAVPVPARVRVAYVPVRWLMPVPVHVDFWPEEADLLPTEADLTAAEVEARYALHSVKACIGRPITVRVGVGRIEVEGIVETEERKDAVLMALRGIPHVGTEIRTVAEEAAREPFEKPESEQMAGPSGPTDADVAATPKLAIEDLLKRYFGASRCAGSQGDVQSACVQQEIAGLSREALAHSEAAQAHAWALRRLVEWGPFLRRHELRTSSLRLLDLMVRDHMAGLRHDLEEWRAGLKPILSTLSRGDSSGRETGPMQAKDEGGDWVTASLLRVCSDVEDAGNLTLGTFAETNRPVAQPELAMKDLLSKLDGLNGEFSELEADVRAELSGLSRTMVSSGMPELK